MLIYIHITLEKSCDSETKKKWGKFTLDRVRFLGTSFKSSFKSVGSGMPKEKPPYLKENILQTKCVDFETCA